MAVGQRRPFQGGESPPKPQEVEFCSPFFISLKADLSQEPTLATTEKHLGSTGLRRDTFIL